MSTARILVVEDEPAIRRGVVDALRASQYEVTEAADGAEGLRHALSLPIDLILLDLLLPKKDGLEVLAEVRRQRPTLPVIVLTARGAEEDRVRGLRMGADDYVIKPFSARELLARVEAVLRRALGRPGDIVQASFGRATIDFERRELRWSKHDREELSATEAAILSCLVQNRERAVSRDELLQRVWGIGAQGAETRTIDMHIARLRSKLREAGGTKVGEAIVTVRRHGYMAGPDWQAG